MPRPKARTVSGVWVFSRNLAEVREGDFEAAREARPGLRRRPAREAHAGAAGEVGRLVPQRAEGERVRGEVGRLGRAVPLEQRAEGGLRGPQALRLDADEVGVLVGLAPADPRTVQVEHGGGAPLVEEPFERRALGVEVPARRAVVAVVVVRNPVLALRAVLDAVPVHEWHGEDLERAPERRRPRLVRRERAEQSLEREGRHRLLRVVPAGEEHRLRRLAFAQAEQRDGPPGARTAELGDRDARVVREGRGERVEVRALVRDALAELDRLRAGGRPFEDAVGLVERVAGEPAPGTLASSTHGGPARPDAVAVRELEAPRPRAGERCAEAPEEPEALRLAQIGREADGAALDAEDADVAAGKVGGKDGVHFTMMTVAAPFAS